MLHSIKTGKQKNLKDQIKEMEEQQHVIQKRIYANYPDLFLDNIICVQFPQWTLWISTTSTTTLHLL